MSTLLSIQLLFVRLNGGKVVYVAEGSLLCPALSFTAATTHSPKLDYNRRPSSCHPNANSHMSRTQL